MTREEAQDYIREHATDYFETDKRGRGYICPICGSGSGRKGTGITTQDNEHFTCWTGCFTHADIFDIIGIKEGLTDFNDKFRRACEIFGVRVDDNHSPFPQAKPKTHKAKAQPIEGENDEDYTAFCIEASKHIEETEYRRGIRLETLKAYGVGYVPKWRHPKSTNAPETPRLIIPNGKGYLARLARDDVKDSEKPYVKQRAGHAQIWNNPAMSGSQQPVYVVEGEIDALSIIDAGGMAVALCSASNAGKFPDTVKRNPPKQGIIITPDNDEAGRKAGAKLEEGLTQAGIFSYRHDLPEKYKDANAFLMTDRPGFTAWVQEGISACKGKMQGITEQARAEFEREAVYTDLKDFLRTLETSREGKAIPTGFTELDKLLDGGLYPGLYTLGAISSLGKTAFILQVSDQIAAWGRGVLIFSLEMSRNELIARSLSRLTRLRCEGHIENAKTTLGILKADFNPQEHALFMRAVQEYRSYADKLFITEGIGDIGTAEIRRKIERFMSYSEGIPPITVVDYAQILAPASDRLTDKQNTDRNVLELKRISRDYQIPIIAISSFNRENYAEPVSMASFKESGAVEYSSDVLIGLQYAGFDYLKNEKETDHKRRIRERLDEIFEATKQGQPADIECKILKNRNGVKGTVKFEFHSRFNLFIERGLKKKE